VRALRATVLALAPFALAACQLLGGLEAKELVNDSLDGGAESAADVGTGEVYVPEPEPADCHDVDPKYTSARFHMPGDGPDGTSFTVDDAAGVVTDKTTGLMWQRKTGSLPRAEATCDCTKLVLAGYTDWRLPSYVELITIVDYAKNPDANGTGTTQPAINVAVFPDTEIGAYWTTTSRSGGLDDIYALDFIDGRVIQFTDKGLGESYYRCVRTAVPPAEIGARFTVNGGTATDAYTGLTWARASSPTKLTYAQSAGYCAGLKVDGTGGFRLPAIKELVGLVDKNLKNYPPVDKTAFPSVKQESLFSSTKYAADPTGQAWKVSLSDGQFFRGIDDDATYAMCVR
jgi:hypothetical protein